MRWRSFKYPRPVIATDVPSDSGYGNLEDDLYSSFHLIILLIRTKEPHCLSFKSKLLYLYGLMTLYSNDFPHRFRSLGSLRVMEI